MSLVKDNIIYVRNPIMLKQTNNSTLYQLITDNQKDKTSTLVPLYLFDLKYWEFRMFLAETN